MPEHVGIIMDGNRRFSKRLMQQPWKGHEWGKEKLNDVINWCAEAGVRELTVFALSTQNFSRPKKEFDYLMQLFDEEVRSLIDRADELVQDGLQVRFIGRVEMLPDPLPSLMEELEDLTADGEDFLLNVAVAYGGREEIVDAAKRVAQDVADGTLSATDVDEHVFARRLYLQSEPEMIIRTGGERRVSNFLPWQSTYTEWFFVDDLWPEFSRERFNECLEEFSTRERRFGK